jgi:hypothetical protein
MKTYIIGILFVAMMSLVSCNDSFLNLQPTDKVTSEAIFGSSEGVKVFMANLYSQAPIEDFAFTPDKGFNTNGEGGGLKDPNNGCCYPYHITDEAIGSQVESLKGWYPGSEPGAPGNYDYWVPAYKLNRDINMLVDVIPTLPIDKAAKEKLKGEAMFLRAYLYFALVKRYGGVPIITKNAGPSDGPEALNVPRSTEKQTWDFALACADTAALFLGDDDGTRRRASKWSALALKSRMALHAASVAKYWESAPLSGPAVDAKLVGLSAEDAKAYYTQCIVASEAILKSSKYSLYKPTPATPAEAAENYRTIFEDPNKALSEVIFLKGYTLFGANLGTNQDQWGAPIQTTDAWPLGGRLNVTLDMVDMYENYSNPGQSAPIVTTTDGSLDYQGYKSTKTYLQFSKPTDIFVDKDARLHASVILPGSTWKGTQIIIQGGLIKPDGTIIYEPSNNNVGVNVGGTMYYPLGGGPSVVSFSGFYISDGNHIRTGFGLKKFMNQNLKLQGFWNQSTTDWIDFRLAEVMLNHAEAVLESSSGDATLAAKSLNDIRRRAAFSSILPLTLENVLRERKVELAFENLRYWDLIRRRDYHTEFSNRFKHSLVPVFDTRTMKYIFVREKVMNTNPQTFPSVWYYKPILGVGSNGLIQNPQY